VHSSTRSGDPEFLIIGDLNAYAMEDPIAALKSAG
jgi:predicted extracellular nuclease